MKREFHLYYWHKGILQQIYEEENYTARDEEEVKTTLEKIIRAMKTSYNPMKYSFKVLAEDGSFYVVERHSEDLRENTYTCVHFKQWNWEEETTRKNRKELVKAILKMGVEQ